jgi:hypothetical protein
VQAVNTKIADMQHRGEMRDLNPAFKAARTVDRSLRYHNCLHAKRAGHAGCESHE